MLQHDGIQNLAKIIDLLSLAKGQNCNDVFLHYVLNNKKMMIISALTKNILFPNMNIIFKCIDQCTKNPINH